MLSCTIAVVAGVCSKKTKFRRCAGAHGCEDEKAAVSAVLGLVWDILGSLIL